MSRCCLSALLAVLLSIQIIHPNGHPALARAHTASHPHVPLVQSLVQALNDLLPTMQFSSRVKAHCPACPGKPKSCHVLVHEFCEGVPTPLSQTPLLRKAT